MANYREEFPDYPEDQMPALSVDWWDGSWRNDACPSFHRLISGAKCIVLYIDYLDRERREFPETERFVVFLDDFSKQIDAPRYGFEDLAGALAKADELALGEAFP